MNTTKWRTRGRWFAIAAVALAAGAVAATAILVETRTIGQGTSSQGSRNVDNPYPASACASGNPTSLLLPVGAMANFELNPGPAFSDGGRELGFGRNSNFDPRQWSAANIWEQMQNRRVPNSAIQNSSSFWVSRPLSIGVITESISGFTNSQAEATFFEGGKAQWPPPQALVGNVPVGMIEKTLTDYRYLPVPNLVAIQTLPPSRANNDVLVTVEAGSTLIALNFTGGVGLGVQEVLPIVTRALSRISSICGGLDIVPSFKR